VKILECGREEFRARVGAEPLRKFTLAGRAWALPASGWLVQERARDPGSEIRPGAGR